MWKCLKAIEKFKKVITVESYIKDTFNSYLILLNKFYENDIPFDKFSSLLENFNHKIKITEKIIYFSFNKEKCTNAYLSAKLSLYYKFFHREVPYKYQDFFHVKTMTDINTDISNTSSNVLILDEYTDKDLHKFRIVYASDNLCELLKIFP